MNTHYTYFLILLLSVAGPFLLSFDKKVAFYKKWKYLFFPMLIPAVFYIVWDMYFVSKDVWHFNETYITGIKLYNLPLEEILFFFVVPYCCLFIYECIRCYFPNLKNNRNANIFLKILAGILLLSGMFFYKKYYTGWTFILTAIFISAVYVFKKFFNRFDAVSFLVSYAIILIPFLVVNGFLTSIPVVIYNNNENLNFRIITIPFEDVFYGMLLVLMNISLYERIAKLKR